MWNSLLKENLKKKSMKCNLNWNSYSIDLLKAIKREKKIKQFKIIRKEPSVKVAHSM